MLPYTVNDPRTYRRKPSKGYRTGRLWVLGLLPLLLLLAGGYWYIRSHSTQIQSLVAIIDEHGAFLGCFKARSIRRLDCYLSQST